MRQQTISPRNTLFLESAQADTLNLEGLYLQHLPDLVIKGSLNNIWLDHPSKSAPDETKASLFEDKSGILN